MSLERLSSHRKLAVIVAGIVGVVAISCILSIERYDDSLRVEAHWPERLATHAPNHLVVGVERAAGNPIEGAGVELGLVDLGSSSTSSIDDAVIDAVDSGEGYRALATVRTDASGTASLVIPPVNELRPADGADGRDVVLVLQVGNGMKRRIGYVDYPTASGTELHLTTDRPLYQPGQTIHMRGLLLEAATRRPLPAAASKEGAAVEYTVHGPRDNLLFRERALVSAAGVSSQSFALAPDGQQGDYELSLDYRGTKVSKTVEVRAYEKPTFEVDLDIAAATTEDSPSLGATLAARYFYGDPVAGGRAHVEVHRADTSDMVGSVDRVLDATGRAEFDLKLPNSLVDEDPGQALVVDASVTDASGRVQVEHRTVSLARPIPDVEILPVGAPLFRGGRPNRAAVLVTDQRGEPLAGQDVRVQIAQTPQPRWQQRTTDEHGRAEIVWTPKLVPNREQRLINSTTDQLVVHRELPVLLSGAAGEQDQYRVPVTVAVPDAVIVRPHTSTPRAGSALSFELDLPDQQYALTFGDALHIVAMHDGVALASTRVEIDPKHDETVEGSIDLGPASRGLTSLVVLDRHARKVGNAPLWVRQASTSSVQVDLGDRPKRPGGRATAALAFPVADQPSDGSANKQSGADTPPVTFGLWAVDEALYALEERAELPLSVLLPQSAEEVRAVVDALGRPELSTGNAEATAARLARSTSRIDTDRIRTTSWLDQRFERHQKKPWTMGWLIFLGALALLPLVAEARRAGQLTTWRVVVWPILVLFCVMPFVLLGVLIVANMLPNRLGDGMLGGLSLAAFVIPVGSLWRSEKVEGTSVWRWPLSLVISAAILALAAFEYGYLHANDYVWNGLIEFFFVTLAGLVMLEALLWCAALWQRDHRLSTVCLIAIFSAGTLLPLVWTFGTTNEAKFMAANSAVQNQVTFGADSGGGAADRAVQMLAPTDEAVDGPPAGDAAKEPALRVRDFFPDTMIWRPEIASDAQGRAQVDMDLPDSITTWRVHAVANTPDGRLGEASAKLTVRQPFFAQIDLPQQLVDGDTVELPLALVDARDQADGDSQVRVDIETEGAIELFDAPPSVSLPAGERRVVWVSVRARGVGEGSLTVHAHLEGDAGAAAVSDGDAVRRQTRVVADGRQRLTSKSSVVGDGFTAVVDVPGDAVAGTSHLRVDLLPGPTAAALEGLDAMLREPHGCFEQTTSIAYPNILVLRTLEQTRPADWPGGAQAYNSTRDRAEKLVSQSYQRILTFQDDSGGFALYPGQQPRRALTAYGLLQLAEIQQVLDVDASSSMRDAANWLRRRQNPDGGFSGPDFVRANSDDSDPAATALTLWALSRLPMAKDYRDSIDRAAKALAAMLDGQTVDNHERALAANALLAAGRTDAAAAQAKALADTAQRQQKLCFWTTRHTTWTGGWGSFADVATTAMAARAMAELATHATLSNEAMAYLATKRRPGGGWGTTEATVWALRALNSAYKGGSSEPVRLSVEADGKSLDEVRVIPERGVPHTIRADLEAGEHRVDVSAAHPTGVVAQTTVSYAVPWSSPEARGGDAPFDLALRVDKPTLEAGESAHVEVDLANRRDRPSGAAIVELPIPPGAWAAEASVEPAAGSGVVDRVERTPTHLVVYLSNVDADATIALSYDFVARLGGHYRLPPVVAYPYYAPAPNAEIPGVRLDVAR